MRCSDHCCVNLCARFLFLTATVMLPITAGAEDPPTQSPGTEHCTADDSYLRNLLKDSPEEIVALPDRELHISQSIKLITSHAGLRGQATIVMSTPNQPIVHAHGLHDITLEGLTLKRSTDSPDNAEAVLIENCRNVNLERLNVIDNRSLRNTIYLLDCKDSRVTRCSVVNYKQIGTNDRKDHAFKCIDGHGITFRRSFNSMGMENSVVERRLFADLATREKYQLGRMIKGVSPVEGMPDYFPAWHQGAGMGSFRGKNTVYCGNYIENACQGFDFQTDHSILSNNIIRYAQTGIKSMHFTENVIITNNNVSYTDLWGLVMAPGPMARPPLADDDPKASDKEYLDLMRNTHLALPEAAEVNNGNIVANNIFSHFGRGYEYYNWTPVLHIDDGFLSVINIWGQWQGMKRHVGQFHPDSGIKSVLVQGNLIYNSEQDGVLKDGTLVYPAPKYRYAIYRNDGEYSPRQVFISGNLIHSGYEGVCNTETTNQEQNTNMIIRHQAR